MMKSILRLLKVLKTKRNRKLNSSPPIMLPSDSREYMLLIRLLLSKPEKFFEIMVNRKPVRIQKGMRRTNEL
jgi:hypothetical protein